MKKILQVAFAIIGFVAITTGAKAADWSPPGPIKLMIAFAAGGGADTQARLIAEELETRTGWEFIPEQVTGKGGLNLLMAMKDEPNDGTVIGMVVSETLGYGLYTSGTGLTPADFTALTMTAGTQMGIVSKTASGWNDMNEVIAAAKGGQEIRFGVMSPRLGDLAYMLGKENGVEFNIVTVRGGKAVMNGVNAGDLDVGWMAGIQAKGVVAGDLVNLASGLSEPLTLSPDAPLISDLGVPFDAGAYFMFAAPGGMADDARNALAAAIGGVVTDEFTKAGALIKKAFGGALTTNGAELDAVVLDGFNGSETLLKAVSQ